MTQLPLPIILSCDPRAQLMAARKLQRIVNANRRAPATISFREKRAAMLKVTRAQTG